MSNIDQTRGDDSRDEPGGEKTTSNPCLNCGACCTRFRVSFYWSEADDAPGGHVPAAMTVQVSPLMRAMQGTHPRPERCAALCGEPGKAVHCSIYAQRPTPCREFDAWDQDGRANPRCNAARSALGLRPLEDGIILYPAG